MAETPATNSQAAEPDGPHVEQTPTPAVTPMQPLLVDAETAAALLSISGRTLWGLTRLGDGGDPGGIRCVRVGRSVRYAPQDLSEWIDAKRKARTGE